MEREQIESASATSRYLSSSPATESFRAALSRRGQEPPAQ